MKSSPKYSVVVPVYNRPQEVEELLQSLTKQSYKNFEVIIVEDGSAITCEKVIETFKTTLTIHYFFKQNTGPGPSRNFGFEKAVGEYLVVFDSDCILPSHYFEAVENYFEVTPLDAWGGPDRGHEDFTPLQQAMGYTMSSFFTTGGIRGGSNRIGSFQPRSFNMGISRKVFDKTGGFKFDRYAEDIEFSIRIKKAGFKSGLISDAFVYHKRRTSLDQFYHQVFNFGRGRVLVGKLYPSEIKLTHWFPSLFFLGMLSVPILSIVDYRLSIAALILYLIYFTMIATGALFSTKSLLVSILSIPSAFVQMTGYGIGFLKERLK
jgi:glycosyltransferase involved in cell wall biosynthesis